MKKKILSLLMCICVAFGCLFSFAGCSIVKEEVVSGNDVVVVNVNGKEYTKTDLLSNFYTFLYQNYALIYNGTDSSIIEEKFYNSFIKTQIVMQKAEEALDAGEISYREKDEAKVWENVESYFRTQIETYEKDLYNQDETKYPVWLQTNDSQSESETFKPYEDPSIIDSIDKGEVVQKLSKEQIEAEDEHGNSKYKDVFNAMFNYVSDKEKDENDEDVNIYTEIKDQEGSETRRQAYANYMENLFLNAKAEGRQTTEKELLLEQIVDIYDSYYQSKISELFQRHYEEELVLTSSQLSEESIVKLFVQSLNADKQNFLNEADYISVITSQDTELILYHNNDKFFTVQHILLKFDDELVNLIKEDPFYVDISKNDLQLEVYEQFMKNREEIVKEYYPEGIGALTDINEEQAEKMPSIRIDGYYDYYTYSKANGYVKATEDTEGAKKMATTKQIVDCYNFNYLSLMSAVRTVWDDETEFDTQNEDIKYILETVLTMKKAGKTFEEVSEKVSSLLFIELSWIFSDDGLYNTIYKQLGYVMANYPDENNNFSHEFVDLAKTIFEAVKSGNSDMSDVSLESNVTITKDGVHIIKLDNVFKQGTSLVDVSGIDLTDIDAVTKIMKQTYICNGSNQTVYDYYRDLVYSNLAGDDQTTGTYFEDIKNTWLQEYLNGDKISFENRISYEEIMGELY